MASGIRVVLHGVYWYWHKLQTAPAMFQSSVSGSLVVVVEATGFQLGMLYGINIKPIASVLISVLND